MKETKSGERPLMPLFMFAVMFSTNESSKCHTACIFESSRKRERTSERNATDIRYLVKISNDETSACAKVRDNIESEHFLHLFLFILIV